MCKHFCRSSRKSLGKTIFPLVLLLVPGLCLTASTVKADRRIFPHTYPYMTLPRGGFELEYYLDARYIEADDPSTVTIEDDIDVDWQHQLEFEYGITDHTDFGFYNVFRQEPYSSLKYRGIKLRTRHRFGESGQWPLDVGTYLEFYYFDDELKLEERLILAKTLGQWEINCNIKFEHEWAEAKGGDIYKGDFGETETEFNPTLGIGYHFNENLALGIEYFAITELEDYEWGPYIQYVGLSVSITTKKFWWSVSFQPQVSGFDDEVLFQARSLFGIYL